MDDVADGAAMAGEDAALDADFGADCQCLGVDEFDLDVGGEYA